MSDFNDQVIADFNANGGKPGGYFKDAPVLLLHAIGAKSGVERTQPLMFLPQDDNSWFVFASYAGGPKDPSWFHNIVAQPEFDISVGDGTTIERLPVRARVLEGAERDATYARQASLFPQFADYAQKTTRTIPVVELTRR
ncbi:nitroreductase/quinone reductase family protein [Devosia neptuniae]|jgi:deazaflavin-dependent oxidoreductase (nitroreductase family)|uniref:nitroreductase/quinone reductase family protein n=1 Tax=Devosia TaxID=46913 RepID=UPI0022B07A4D|nr:nitroreductase/quinone reductase family protein [Devosia neptuniae]MCZ4346183.1 nitroreductase/quinone reductase family protein [Devosia neptuniae]|tara:strand:+ start:2370 stop:2789 length:420 start_codon:yes stop_codon:yes gene_type:complete